MFTFVVKGKISEDDEVEENNTMHRCCTRKVLYKRLPVFQWLPKYKFNDHGIADLVAGITVGLTVIPQAIAFANVAGLPPQVSCWRFAKMHANPYKVMFFFFFLRLAHYTFLFFINRTRK